MRHQKNFATIGALLALILASQAAAVDIEWTDFSSWTPYALSGDITLCDGKTVSIAITQKTTPFVQSDGTTVGYPFFLDEHSVFENVNDIDYVRFRTRAASAVGNFNNAAPNSYTMTWDFSSPLDHRNFFVVGQLLQYNVATITAYAPDGETVVNGSLQFEQLRAEKSIYTFFEPLSWTPGTGELKKSGTSGSNSKYGFFSIPEGVEVGRIVIRLDDNGRRGRTADEVNYGIGCQIVETLECSTDLIADGGSEETAVDVGDVTVLQDEEFGSWDVTYETTGSWEILEVALDVACDPDEFPQTKKGNPKTGKFCEKVTLPAGTQSYTFEDVLPRLDRECGHSACPYPCTYFAAHAVVQDPAMLVCDDAQGRVYGVERGSGDLYEVNLALGTATMIADIEDPVPGNVNSPNGLANDETTGRLYFSATSGANSDLWFWDGESQVLATGEGKVPGEVAGAAFHNGEYYYVVNQTDDLVKVQFDGDGMVTGVVSVCENFAGGDGFFRFGDIAITPDGGTLYGSSLRSGNPTAFFSVGLSDCTYTEISNTDGIQLQLALGSDGNLYGHSTGGGNFYEVDPATGATTDLGLVTGSLDNFTDLAAGPCSLRQETAWGAGTDFPGSNWATYFSCGDCE